MVEALGCILSARLLLSGKKMGLAKKEADGEKGTMCVGP